MRPVAEIRLANLEFLIEELGTMEAVAQVGGTSSVYLSQVRRRTLDIKTGRPREMGGAIARRLELGAKKPLGWMDQDHAEASRSPLKAEAQAVAVAYEAMTSEERARFNLLMRAALSVPTDAHPNSAVSPANPMTTQIRPK